MAIVEFKDVSRVYRNGEHEQRALDHVNLSLDEGQFIVILGPSGAGKSTLLNMLGGLDSPTEGTILVGGKDISTLTPNELAEYRAANVGFIFQSYNLIPTLTVIENVALVKEIMGECTVETLLQRWLKGEFLLAERGSAILSFMSLDDLVKGFAIVGHYIFHIADVLEASLDFE